MAEERTASSSLPPGLRGVNWGAVLAGPLWALFYGTWWWLAALVGFRAVLGLFFVFVNAGALGQGPVLIAGLQLAGAALHWGLLAFFGLRANSLVWDANTRAMRDTGLITVVKTSPQTVEQYVTAQQTWVKIGWALVIIGYVMGYMESTSIDAPSMYASVGAGAIALCGLWLFDHSRRNLAPQS